MALAAVELAQTGELLAAVLRSLQGLVVGFVLGVSVGVGLGVLMGRFKAANYLFDPFVTALYATPTVSLIPLIMLWFGLGLTAKIVIIWLSVFFTVVISTYAGVRNVSRSTVDVARAYGASNGQVMRLVVLPSALPFVMTGIRLSVGRAVIGMVVAELFTSLSGLGSLLTIYSNTFATARMFVVVITLALMGLGLTAGARYLEQRMAPWKESERAD